MTNVLEILTSLSEELRNAIAEGYDIVFYLEDGHVLSEADPEIKYAISHADKQPRPCASLQATIYRIVLPNGIKGFAIVSWKRDNDE